MIEKEQFEDIKDKLRVCREERGLNKEDQKRNFRVDYTKELAKFFEAERDNNQYGIIKALCDMIVVCVNAGGNIGCASCEFTNINLTYPIIYRSIDIKGLLYELRREGYDPYKCLLETIKELNSRTGSWSEEEGKWVKDKGAYTKEEAREVAKEILKKDYVEYPQSVLRAGQRYWQFVAENHFEIKEWYKADYASCKLESVE
ncbi:hypothetical protein CQA57_07000 [Helicobacter anseris]|uniref:Uncharacterized protein n=1 Tax=Helicobacter anseris TaxID=375926 RepID=A0A3D8J4G5_9HELI|nr:hypothetical protein [Helicobacter anseris]RDU72343.1 hypothetical protein CQA57_07000 [Helicobacter anseris]